MKTFFNLIIISFLLINTANGQSNTYSTLLTADPLPVALDNASSASVNADTATAACDGVNTFWGIENISGILKEFDLTNNVITYTGNYVPSCQGVSLSICNTLNGASVSPTFYTSQSNTAYYWDGANTWLAAGTAADPLHNASGNGNNLYYESISGPTQIIKYDGTVFSTIYSTTKLPGCADIAVDNNGNFIYVTFGSNAMSDSIQIISPAGQILNQYPFAVNVGNAYGCFLLNSVFYLALGAGNTVFPNSLIPVTFTGSTANIGAPVFLPAGTVLTYDLASCNPGSALGINILPAINEIAIAPNPATGNIIISGIPANHCIYSVYDVTGSEVIPAQTRVSPEITIDISALKKGVYFVELKIPGSAIHKRFCKM